ncbi:MAG TPA: dihydrolipoamide acetyltransferase family protein [Thermoanaerobaculaceae bacterium]|nr:dihydrolipoamide acetyltransferase family protein [Thermoanaerobaculaceae bacterium]
MPVNVVMPQMGESITEGTIVRWFKGEGEAVAKDEPLLEISTDKVDAEVPSPAAGTLAKILKGPGQTVAVETVIGVIAQAGEAVGAPTPEAASQPSAVEPKPAEPAPARPAPAPAAAPPREPVAAAPQPRPVAAPSPAAPATPTAPSSAGESEAEAMRRRSSPLVRRIAAEHSVDLALVPGTGLQGRVTKDDILAFVEGQRSGAAAAVATAPAASAARPAPAPAPTPAAPAPARTSKPTVPYATGATLGPTGPFAGDERREPMSVMRQKIAEHMVLSRRTSPHVHTVFEVDMSRVVALRESAKATFEARHGLKLTYTPFFLAAVIEALRTFPVVNATLDGNDIVYHRHVNLGVAVALPHGLIVPVVRHAEELSLVGLQRTVTDLATRARNKQLKPEDVGGSTFSITNPGPYGGLYGLPIINQPNVAILSTGGIHRRPVVVADELGREAIAIRDMVYLALSFDHRLVDGATADQFMAVIKASLEAGAFELG